MFEGHSIAAVVPAYNEQTQITRVIETMPDFVDRIIVVNDGSSDRTGEIVRELAARMARVELVEHAENQGVGGAIATGYKRALAAEYDVAVVMAGDGQMAPQDLPALLAPVVHGEADYAKGNRLFTGQAFSIIPKIRYFGNMALSLFTKIASGYWHVADSQSGYAAINRRALAAIDWDSMHKRYGQPNDLLVRLNVANMRVVDVPIQPLYRIGEQSGLRVHTAIFTISWLLVRLFFWRIMIKYVIRNFHPLVFFYFFGIAMLVTSAAFFVRLWILRADYGYMPEISFLVWLFTFSIGFNSLGFAAWFDYEDNKHLGRPEVR